MKVDRLVQITMTEDHVFHLALCILVLLNAKTCFCHCFLYHTYRIWALVGWIDAFFGDQCSNFFSKRCKVMVSFLLSYLHFAFLQDLKERKELKLRASKIR